MDESLGIDNSAMGKITRNEMTSRPKKRVLCTANAVKAPITNAKKVALAATCNDNVNAAHKSLRLHAAPNHGNVRPGSGNVNVCSSVVKA
jgi:hypothetical protein